jgi:hypothetical protein
VDAVLQPVVAVRVEVAADDGAHAPVGREHLVDLGPVASLVEPARVVQEHEDLLGLGRGEVAPQPLHLLGTHVLVPRGVRERQRLVGEEADHVRPAVVE